MEPVLNENSGSEMPISGEPALGMKRKLMGAENDAENARNASQNAGHDSADDSAKKKRLMVSNKPTTMVKPDVATKVRSGLPRFSSRGRSIPTRSSASAGSARSSVSSTSTHTALSTAASPRTTRSSIVSDSSHMPGAYLAQARDSSSSSSSSSYTTATAGYTTSTHHRTPPVTPQRKGTTPYRSTNTPSGDGALSGGGGGASALLVSRIRRVLGNNADGAGSSGGPEKLRAMFDNAFTYTDEKITGIINGKLKVKNKWDYKDKALKQASVISELRGCFRTTFEESRRLRDLCLNAEHAVGHSVKSAYEALQEALGVIAGLTTSETRLRREYTSASEQLAVARSALKTAEDAKAPLEAKAVEAEAARQTLAQRLAVEEATRSGLEAEVRRVREEVSTLQHAAKNDTTSAVSKLEEEVETLKRERAKMDEAATSALAAAKAETEEIRAKLNASGGDMKVAENRAEMAERDVARLTAELTAARTQLADKESDLRSTLQGMAASQASVAEEKGAMRAELMQLQSRVQTLESERISAVQDLAAARQTVTSVEHEKIKLVEQVETLSQSVEHMTQELSSCKEAQMQLSLERELRCKAEMREREEKTERIAACAQMAAMNADAAHFRTSSEAQMAALEQKATRDLQESRDEATSLKVSLVEESERAVALAGEVAQLKNALDSADKAANHEAVQELAKASGELEVLRRRVASAEAAAETAGGTQRARIQALEAELKRGEGQRRKLHNLVQELRGNVRVFARVRPFLPNDGFDVSALPDPSIVPRADGASLKLMKPDDGKSGPSEQSFSFDRVFGPSSSQEAVFGEVSEFVQSALDGYSVCLMSYGQTGSGKTHTMQGSGDGPMRGIIPRAMQQVGAYKTALEAKGWRYSMEVTFVEIYNETIRDLLRSSTAPNGASDAPKHEIKKDANGTTYVTDVNRKSVDPNDCVQVNGILELAARHRSVTATAMNEQSSRSHSVFTLHLTAEHATQGTSLRGDLSLVDLAGSERLDRSQATGAAAKEAMAINKSLSALKDVFVAIGSKAAHVPFRNSKLTYLLQPALSGDGKTLMMVNLSPTAESAGESLCSLRFASQVNQCELGKPRKQLKDSSSAMTSKPSASRK